MTRIAICLCLALALASCAHYLVHPGSVNRQDSVIYDTLQAAQITIDNSRVQLANGVLPASFRPVINAIESAYDPAVTAYKTWHTAALAGTDTPDQLRQLNAALAALNATITAFRGTK